MKKLHQLYTLLLCSMFSISLSAQGTFSGWVVDHEGNPLIGATIQWKDSLTVGTASDVDGKFEVPRLDTVNGHILLIRHVSYAQVEVEIFPYENHLKLKVEADAIMETAVEVTTTRRDAFNSTLNPLNIETLSACELKRAACCSLAESFENNGTVNVSHSDAVTGAREVEMLGLRGIYTQMMIENRPTLNRLGRAYGLEYIPGSWIESIQVSKGASTVRNGVQGITGQINTELIKPQKADPFYINLYAGNIGRFELNTNLAHKFNDKWATGLLLHGNYYQGDIDHNHDYFLDVPKKKQINGLWRLIHTADDLHLEFNVQGLMDNRFGGQTAKLYENHLQLMPTRLYQIENNTKRLEVFGKAGYMGFDNPLQSFALVWGVTVHDQKSHFGDNIYDALQKSFYTNLIFQTPLSANKEHNFNAGVNYQLDNFDESFTELNLGRLEQMSSLFGEYDFNHVINKDKGRSFGLIFGMRGDWLQTGTFQKIIPSPRANIKYNFNDNFVIRASGGRGMRMANLLIENIRYMPGSRSFIVDEKLQPEIAWNYGINMSYNFQLGARDGSLNIDAYRTDFENQLISDVDIATDELHFYNLDGKSFANSFLVTWTQDLAKGFELRLAYKFNDVRSTMNDSIRWQTFSPQHRGLVTLHYVTPNKGWQFNANVQFTGPQRLPLLSGNTSDLPDYRQKAMAPAFVLFNAQVTKYFKNGFEAYIGEENLGNYTQIAPILGADNPFGSNANARPFDATAVFAPIMGVMGYAGVRYTFKGKNKAGLVIEDKHDHPKDAAEIGIRTSAQCGMCKTTIDEGLEKVDGVYHASLDMKTKIVNIHYDAKKTNPDALRKAITELGYNADDMKRNEDIHDGLPECCKSK
jgi:outer membrane receptor for ferrienterochelin and colicin/copper chaperone CopZ